MTVQTALQLPVSANRNVKVSIDMPADMLAALKVAGFQRRSLGETEASTAHLVREAVTEWLEKEIAGTTVIPVQLRS